MAKRRNLKKAIHSVCDELTAELVATALYGGQPKEENVVAVLTSIEKVRANYISRVSHPEPGMAMKAYFKDLVENFNKQAVEIIDQIANLH